MKEMEEMFKKADVNNDGKLTIDEVRDVLQSLHIPAADDPRYIQMTMDLADTDGNGTIDYSEFVEFTAIGRNEEAEMRAAFKTYDLNDDNRISAHELQTALAKQGSVLSLQDAEDIISKVDHDRDGYINFIEFKKMMHAGMAEQEKSVHTSAMSAAALVVTVHLTDDEEFVRHEEFEDRMKKGIRIRKHGRRGWTVRKVRLDMKENEPPRLVWPKAGMKMREKGYYDISTLTDVSEVSLPDTSIQLTSSSGAVLMLQARSPEEHKALFDGFKVLCANMRSSGQANTGGLTSAVVKMNSDLVKAFSPYDNGSGFVDPITLGNVLGKIPLLKQLQQEEMSKAQLRSTISRVPKNSSGDVDYKVLALEIAKMLDPEEKAKAKLQHDITTALRKFDVNRNGFITSLEVGQGIVGLKNLPNSHKIRSAVQQVDLDGTGEMLDYARFARIIAGLDQQANEELEEEMLRNRDRIQKRIADDYTDLTLSHVQSILKQFDPHDNGSINPVNLGQAINQLGKLNQTNISSLLSATEMRRDGSLVYEGELEKRLVDLFTSTQEDGWRQVFATWDKNRNGTISIRELEKALGKVPRKQIETLMRAADLDFNGTLNEEEFITLKKHIEVEQSRR